LKELSNNGKPYQLAITLLFVFTGNSILLYYFIPEIDKAPFTIGASLILLVTAAFLFLGIRGRVLLGVGIFLFLAAVVYLWGWSNTLDYVQGFIYWLATGMPTPELEELTNMYHFTATALMTAGLCGLSPLLAKERWLRYGLAAAAVVYLLLCMIFKTQLTQPICVLLLIYITFCCVEIIQEKKWGSRTPMMGKKIVFWLSPFLAVFLLLLLLLPADQKPYDWKFVQTIWNKIEQSRIWISQRWGNREEGFQMTFTGFSPSNELGGNVTPDRQTQLLLTNDVSGTGGLYLTGAIYNTFTGTGWEYTAQEEPWVTWADSVESLYGAYCYDPLLVSDYFHSASVTVTYEKMKTHYLFAPSKTYLVTTDSKASYDGQNAGFTFQKAVGYGTTYRLNFYRMNLGNDSFWEFAEAASSDTGRTAPLSAIDETESLRTAMTKYFPQMPYKLTASLLQEHRDNIRSRYLDHPQLSPQMSAYLNTLLEGADTPIEKCKRIESKLSEYAYTQTPGDIPEGEDFLDYFLLTKQEGYCTYFATAFALLTRAADIPTRYVQGYCIPNIQGRGEVAEVTAAMAHAWPEAYFEGLGWIPFEPTPGFASARYQRWSTKSQQEAIAAQIDSEDPDALPNTPEEVPETPELQEEDSPQNTIEIPAHIIFLFLGLLIASAILIFTLDHLIRRRRYNRMDTPGKLNSQVQTTLKLLAYLGYPMAPYDTITELCTRLQTADIPQATIAFLTAYEQARYGKAPVTAALLTTAQTQTALLLTTLKHQFPRTYYRFLLLPPHLPSSG
jgi:transglutaminase-like putative cysteine protease